MPRIIVADQPLLPDDQIQCSYTLISPSITMHPTVYVRIDMLSLAIMNFEKAPYYLICGTQASRFQLTCAQNSIGAWCTSVNEQILYRRQMGHQCITIAFRLLRIEVAWQVLWHTYTGPCLTAYEISIIAAQQRHQRCF